MASKVEIHKQAGVVIVDGVTFCPTNFSEIVIEGGHPSGPVFTHGAAKAIITRADADKLVAAGVTDKRF